MLAEERPVIPYALHPEKVAFRFVPFTVARHFVEIYICIFSEAQLSSQSNKISEGRPRLAQRDTRNIPGFVKWQ